MLLGSDYICVAITGGSRYLVVSVSGYMHSKQTVVQMKVYLTGHNRTLDLFFLYFFMKFCYFFILFFCCFIYVKF